MKVHVGVWAHVKDVICHHFTAKTLQDLEITDGKMQGRMESKDLARKPTLYDLAKIN